MFHLISKRVLYIRPVASTSTHVYSFSTSTVKRISKGSNSTDPKSLTISHLLNSCGLSLKSSIRVSRILQFDDLLKARGLTQTHIIDLISKHPSVLLADPYETLKPNFELLGTLGFTGTNLVKLLNKYPRILKTDVHTMVEFFRAYGFSEKQIYALTMKRPRLYVENPHNKFKPTLEFFKSLGFSRAEIARLLSSEPYIMRKSLENQIIPCVKVIRRVLGTDESVLKAIEAYYCLSESRLENLLVPNIAFLMSHGVPKFNVLKLITIHPGSLLMKSSRFTEVVGEVEKLGLDPTNLLFVLAVRSMAVMNKSFWDRKLELYCSLGLSKTEIISALKMQPMCMLTSEKKIRKLMGFFVNELKLKPSIISRYPNILLLSLEKRIIPRCSVLQLLTSNDLFKGKIGIGYAFTMTEKLFVEKFVSSYQHVIPEVVEANQGKLQFEGFSLNCWLI